MAAQAMAHHFETFALGFEVYEALRCALSEVLLARGWTSADRFVALRSGESLRVSPMPRPRLSLRTANASVTVPSGRHPGGSCWRWPRSCPPAPRRLTTSR
jgi:hypothetical protein